MRVSSQEGSMSLIALGAAIGLVGLLLVLLSFYQVWLTHMRSEQIADAAAQGALEGLYPGLQRVVEEKIDEHLRLFWREVDRAVAERLKRWESAYRARRERELGEDGDLSDEDRRLIDSEVAELAPERERQFREDAVRRRQAAIADALLKRYHGGVRSLMELVPLPALMTQFLGSEELGCAVVEAARRFRGNMTAGAARFAGVNGAEVAERPEMIIEKGTPQIRVTVAYRLRLLLWELYLPANQRRLSGTAIKSVKAIAGMSVTVPDRCP